MKTIGSRLSLMIILIAVNGVVTAAPGGAVQPGTINCNGLQNFLTVRSKYGRSALPQLCSQNFTWRGRIDCSKGLPVLRHNLSMADAEWICKKLIYARGEELPYQELRALLVLSGAIPKSTSTLLVTLSGKNFKEVSCGNRLCTSTWMLPDETIIHVTLRRDGEQLATYEIGR